MATQSISTAVPIYRLISTLTRARLSSLGWPESWVARGVAAVGTLDLRAGRRRSGVVRGTVRHRRHPRENRASADACAHGVGSRAVQSGLPPRATVWPSGQPVSPRVTSECWALRATGSALQLTCPGGGVGRSAVVIEVTAAARSTTRAATTAHGRRGPLLFPAGRVAPSWAAAATGRRRRSAGFALAADAAQLRWTLAGQRCRRRRLLSADAVQIASNAHVCAQSGGQRRPHPHETDRHAQRLLLLATCRRGPCLAALRRASRSRRPPLPRRRRAVPGRFLFFPRPACRRRISCARSPAQVALERAADPCRLARAAGPAAPRPCAAARAFCGPHRSDAARTL